MKERHPLCGGQTLGHYQFCFCAAPKSGGQPRMQGQFWQGFDLKKEKERVHPSMDPHSPRIAQAPSAGPVTSAKLPGPGYPQDCWESHIWFVKITPKMHGLSMFLGLSSFSSLKIAIYMVSPHWHTDGEPIRPKGPPQHRYVVQKRKAQHRPLSTNTLRRDPQPPRHRKTACCGMLQNDPQRCWRLKMMNSWKR
jgi:hypothetical protein